MIQQSLTNLQKSTTHNQIYSQFADPSNFNHISQQFISYPQKYIELQFVALAQYNQLQALLQSRQNSIRAHIQHKHHLQLNIQNLQQKNQVLAQTHLQMLNHYQQKLASLQKQNQNLKKTLNKRSIANSQMQGYLNIPLAESNSQQNVDSLKYKNIELNKINNANLINNKLLPSSKKIFPQFLIKHKRSQSLTPIDFKLTKQKTARPLSNIKIINFQTNQFINSSQKNKIISYFNQYCFKN